MGARVNVVRARCRTRKFSRRRYNWSNLRLNNSSLEFSKKGTFFDARNLFKFRILPVVNDRPFVNIQLSNSFTHWRAFPRYCVRARLIFYTRGGMKIRAWREKFSRQIREITCLNTSVTRPTFRAG